MDNMAGGGFMTDFSKRGDEAATASFNMNPSSPGKINRVGGSFPNVDSPYPLEMGHADGHPADMNTVWGIQTQSQRIGGGAD